MEINEARILMKNLFARLSAQEDGSYVLDGKRTADEVEALRIAQATLDGGGMLPQAVQPAAPAPAPTSPRRLPPSVELHLKLTQVLHLKVTHLEEPEYGSSVLGFSSFCLLGFLRRAVFEAVAIVAGFNDVAVMSQPVE